MPEQIDTALYNAYKSGLEIQFQQKGSRLRQYVREEHQSSEYEYYDRIGPVDAVEIKDRHGDTPLLETPHTRRRVGLRDFDWGTLIDKEDKIRMLSDPTSSYTQNAIYALGRKVDDIIVEAMDADAYTGKDGSTVVDFATDGGSTITAGSGLTIAKLLETRERLIESEAVMDDQHICMALSVREINQLLQLTEVKSSDYNTVKALAQGNIDTFMGFKFIRLQRLPYNSGTGVRTCFAWIQDGIILGINQALEVDVSRRPDKRNAWQPYVKGHFAATRTWGEMIAKINVSAAP
jgi:hypothetical protein